MEFKMSNDWFDRFNHAMISACGGQQMLHRNSLKHCVLPFNNFTDISEEWQTVKATELKDVQEGIVGPWALRDIRYS